mgnify:CR=1 FL=1
MITLYFYIWAILNLLVGIWEIYAFQNRDKLILDDTSFWNTSGFRYNFWIDGWSEYCKVDSRYIYRQYVWFFELLNAIIDIIAVTITIIRVTLIVNNFYKTNL